MFCKRCGKEFDSSIPEINAENYGGRVIYTCNHCGKAHLFMRIVISRELNDESISYKKEDDWNNKIVLDSEYYKNCKNK